MSRRLIRILLLWVALWGLVNSATLAPPDLSDADADDTPLVLAELTSSGHSTATAKSNLRNKAGNQTNSVVHKPVEKPEVTHTWILRTKKVRECRRVIKVLRKPQRVCGWEKQDQCHKVPHREKKYRYVCDSSNYCHKESYFVTTYEEKCKTVRKRVCKNWFETKRVPQRLCVDKIHRLKCLKEESCTNHKTCLKWVNKATDQGFKYRQCLRWIQFRKCGISYSQCQLIHESLDQASVKDQSDSGDDEHIITHA